MKTRLTALLLAAVMLALALTACNSGTQDPGSSSSGTLSSSPTSSQTSSAVIDEDAVQVPTPDHKAQIAEYKKTNSDVKGWIKIDGIPVDFPFVHTAAYDNNDYYLRRAWDKSSRFLGCIFADFRTKFGPIGTLSRNLVLYGHNVDDNRESGEMFAQLLRYDDPEWYNEHPYIEVSTENDDMVWVIFAAFYTDINFDYIEPNPDDKTFMYIVDEAIKRSELETNVDVKLTDNILTLSTCTLKYGTRTDQRFVVMARLQRKGENLQELNPTATKNPNPKAPQF